MERTTPDLSLVDINEFQRKVLDFIASDEIDRMIDSTVFKDNPNYKSAIIHGMTIAAMLTSRCNVIYAVSRVYKEK